MSDPKCPLCGSGPTQFLNCAGNICAFRRQMCKSPSCELPCKLWKQVRRLHHIIVVLRNSIEMTALTAQTIEDHVRVKGGRIEVWCLGEWLDLEHEQARAADAAEGET